MATVSPGKTGVLAGNEKRERVDSDRQKKSDKQDGCGIIMGENCKLLGLQAQSKREQDYIR